MDDENKTTNKNEYDPQKDFIVETPQIIEEIIHIKKSTSTNNNPLSTNTDNTNNIHINSNNHNNNNNNNNFIIRKYEKGKFLGKGGFAKCFEMKCCETKRFFAAKVFEKKDLVNSRSRKKLINEIKLHKKLQHENIVNFEHFFEDSESVYILLELCTNQTLNELLKRRKRLSDLEAQYYCAQIIQALLYIHSLNIIHRDLKLGNLFISSGLKVKLGDFGLAAKIKFPGQKRKTICGTPNYIAPEVLEKKNGHSFEVDVWSLGVILYTLLVGKPPFETPEVRTTYKKIRANNFAFPENLQIETKAKQLIISILVLDPIKRPTLREILASEYFAIFASLPESMPLAALALPPRESFVEKFVFKPGKEWNKQKGGSLRFGRRPAGECEYAAIGDFDSIERKVVCSIKAKNRNEDCFQGIISMKDEGDGITAASNNNGFTANMLLDNSGNKNANSNSGNNENSDCNKINNYNNQNNNNLNNNNINQNIFLRNSINKFNTLSKQGNGNNNQQKNCNTDSSSQNNVNNKNLNLNIHALKNDNSNKHNLNNDNTNKYILNDDNNNNNYYKENINEYYSIENKEEIRNNPIKNNNNNNSNSNSSSNNMIMSKFQGEFKKLN